MICTFDFNDHCDPPCGLGYVDYTCPACKRDSKNFADLWFKRYDYLVSGGTVEFECEKCKAKLVYVYDDNRIREVQCSKAKANTSGHTCVSLSAQNMDAKTK